MAAAGQAATGEQFYVTHCVTADSVMNAPGYSVRAASAAGDPDSLKRALEFPPYELPLEMWREKPAKALTPRRLARIKRPAGGIWAAHSVYLEKDTMNRDRSYFTHLIQLPEAVGAVAVLESWDADGWVKEYAPGASKTLPRGRLPVGTAISPAALTSFLTRPQAGPTELSVVVCPRDFRKSAESRRELVTRFLKAVVLVAAALEDEESRRDRLFVHAEPGLVAMLTYAAVCILPPSFTTDLTFTTFEPAHRGIRDYQLATVIGTVLGGTGKGLDADLTTTRGYGIDTFFPEKSSPELREGTDLPPGVEELVDLAMGGEWDLIADVHRLCATEDGAGMDRIRGTIPLARAVSRLNRGGLTSPDLMALKKDRRGGALLLAKAEKVWEYLEEAVLTDALLRETFRDWLADPNRLTEYRRQASEALVRGELAAWESRWELIREVADPAEKKSQIEKAQKSLDKYLPTLAPAARDRLRKACAETGVWPDHHLLAPTTPQELETLLAPDVPPDWQGYTCFAVMGPDAKNWLLDSTRPYRAVMRERVRRHLLAAPSPVLAGYVQQVRPFVASDPVFLLDLFRPFRKECVDFLGHLIDAGVDRIDAADWFNLLDELDVYGSPQWKGFLFRNDHLAKLLTGFKADSVAPTVWGWGLGQLTAQLFDGNKWEVGVYEQLSKARMNLGAAGIPLKVVLPEGGPAKLNAADTILTVMADPASAETFEPGQLVRSYQKFEMKPVDGLLKIYLRGGFNRLDPGLDPGSLAPLVVAFRVCFPVTNESSARSAVTQWLHLSESCPVQTRAVFQYHFVQQCVPIEYHQQLVDDLRQFPFLPEADAWIRAGLAAVAAKRTSERYAPPPTHTPEPEADVVFASPATKRAKKDRGTTRSPARRRQQGGISGMTVVLTLVLLASLVGGGFVIWKFTQTPEKPKDSDSPPPSKPEKKEAPKKDTKKPPG